MDFARKFQEGLSKSLYEKSNNKKEMKASFRKEIKRCFDGIKELYKHIIGEDYIEDKE